jgi:hypothetical protein
MVKEFIKAITTQLKTTGRSVYYKTTSATTDYVLFDVEIFDKSFARADGQIVVDVRYSDIMDLLTVQDEVIAALDNYSYSDENTSANIDFVILNDLSSITDEQYFNELRFEFKLRWR